MTERDSAREGSGVEQRASTEFGRIPTAAFIALWEHPASMRFRYQPIRVASMLMIATLIALWIYYGMTLLRGGLSLGLGLFGLGLIALTFWATLRMILWRLFVLRSGVVMTDEVLAWRNGPQSYLAPWELIDPDGLGIENLSGGKSYDRFFVIRVGDSAEPLYVIRLYARIEEQQAFVGELLRRIPKEKWARRA